MKQIRLAIAGDNGSRQAMAHVRLRMAGMPVPEAIEPGQATRAARAGRIAR